MTSIQPSSNNVNLHVSLKMCLNYLLVIPENIYATPLEGSLN